MARYVRTETGYMGQLAEWPEVISEGKTLDDCRAMLRDALDEMILAYHQIGKPLPQGSALIETLAVEEGRERKTA